MNYNESVSILANGGILHFAYTTLPTDEVELLKRIAEMADKYSRERLWETRKELFRLVNEWKKMRK